MVDQYTEIARLAGGLAHEIKNPLSTIRLNMELMAEDLRDSRVAAGPPRDEEGARWCSGSASGCKTCWTISSASPRSAACGWSRATSTAQVKQALEFFRPKAQEAGIEVVDYLTTDLPTVLVDRESFHGAMLNLVLNAQQAMPDGGQLVVRTYGTADGVALDLIDTGCGMDANTREHVFDAFFSTKRGGTGLGCRRRGRSSRRHGGADRFAERARPRDAVHGEAARARPDRPATAAHLS